MAKKSSSKKIDDNSEIKDKSVIIPQRNKINFELNIKERPDLTERQKLIIDLILDKKTKAIFIDGPAGSSKTFLSVLAGLKLLNQKRVSDILYVRSVIESASRSIGMLPGELNEKFEPYLIPLNDKLEELLPKEDVDKLFKDNRIKALPINFLRGSNISVKYLICDEAQNLTYKELVTVFTRIGEYSKFIFIGDTFQSDINGHSGFGRIYKIFDNDESVENGIFCIKLENKDIVRSGILKFIVEKLEEDQRYNK